MEDVSKRFESDQGYFNKNGTEHISYLSGGIFKDRNLEDGRIENKIYKSKRFKEEVDSISYMSSGNMHNKSEAEESAFQQVHHGKAGTHSNSNNQVQEDNSMNWEVQISIDK